MTTRTTRETTPGKEKRGSSPSSHPSTRTSGQSPNPYKKPASPASQKSVPNYLKPTRSSDPEAFKQQGKKPESARKPDLQRRRSLDKPPSVYQSQRSRVCSSYEKTPTLYARPITKTRKVKNQFSKEDKGKAVVHPRQVENINAPVVLMQSGDICDEKRDEDLCKENRKPASEPEQSDHDGEISCEEDSIAKISDQEPTNDDEDGEDIDAKVVNEHQKGLEIEKTQGGCEEDKDENTVIVEDMHIINDYEETENNDVETPSFELLPDTKQEDDDITRNVINDEKSVAGNVSEDVEEKKDWPTNDSEEGRETFTEREGEVVEKKAEGVCEAPKVQGKKEITVSNDVIEETASKLREQRKNKVKALAGAFETVISLQDPK
ncbi:calmodulin-binding family protein [Striga asiatica]|uniref:Calmodulin-binding family protein n=1 Tax=Striga asiatica TaxID=4170 RepID=A0A5A7Q3Q3_STRAF|nr:calmodulin-binding family protein [Striga asiatica]